jgi:hypothetical protein
MLIAVSSAVGRAQPKRLGSGTSATWFTYVKSEYIAPASDQPGPQAFLVEMDRPGAVIPPHFHRVDQFQVVVSGGGTLGKHSIDALTTHFADAYTPYGPIVVGDDGLAFFTLRPLEDAGANYMPESRAHMVRKARRNVAGRATLTSSRELAELAEPVVEMLLGPESDGLSALLLRLPSGAVADPPRPTGGQYALVVGGSARVEGALLPRWSCIWVGPGEAPVAVEAGEGGVEIVVVQFPGGPGPEA